MPPVAYTSGRRVSLAAAPVPRKLRADASRNRDRILAVAKSVFQERGAAASLDEVARRAGIGPGTLYRHFPTREALIEAVYQSEVEKLVGAADRFAATLPPFEALRAWLLLFVDYVAAKRLIMPALETVEGGWERLLEGSRASVHGSFARAVDRAVQSGELRADADAGDLFRAMVGVLSLPPVPGWEESARRIVDVLLAGVRSAARPPA